MIAITKTEFDRILSKDIKLLNHVTDLFQESNHLFGQWNIVLLYVA